MTNYNIKYFKGKTIEEWMKEPEKKAIQPIIAPSSTTSQGDYWEIKNVNYQRKIKNVRLSKSLIPPMNFDALVKYSIDAKAKGEFYAPNSMLFFATAEALSNSSDSKEKEEARAFIQKSMGEKYPTLLTKLIYNPENQSDEIIHNYGTSDKYSFNENIVGPDREIIKSDEALLEKLLGTNDIEKVKEVFQWINDTPTWIWRLNSKPENKDERVVRFGADSNRLLLSYIRSPALQFPAFRVFEDG